MLDRRQQQPYARPGERQQQRPQPQAARTVQVEGASISAGTRAQANALARFDAVIHNVAIGYREKRRVETADGLSQLWAVGVLAPYVLTALMRRPARLVYLTSELHRRVDGKLDDLQWRERAWNGTRAYSETKFQDAVLAMAVARLWPEVRANAIEPGWVATRMGGPRATGDLAAGAVTQAWLAAGGDAASRVSGGYFFHQARAKLHPRAGDTQVQDRLFGYCAEVSGVGLD